MEWKVKYINYPKHFNNHKKEYMGIIQETLENGDLMMREQLRAFERNLARFCGTKYAVGVSNCTDALYLSLYAAGIGPGDEVITVSHTFVATVAVIHHLGAKPVLVDIRDDHDMNVDLVEKAITSRTKAIVPVQLNGRICSRMDELMKIARKHRLLVIEDSAQALGATYKGRKAGSFGLAGCFSFYPAKLLGAFGDGGAVITNSRDFAESILLLRNHGRGHSEIERWGFNCRMDNLHAALLDFKLKQLPSWIKRRRQIAALYDRLMTDIPELRLPPPPGADKDHFDVFQNYEIEAERHDNLVKYLHKKRIEIMIPWGGKPVHQFRALGFHRVKLPRTDELFKKALMLPMYPELEDKHIKYVAKSIKEFYNKRKN